VSGEFASSGPRLPEVPDGLVYRSNTLLVLGAKTGVAVTHSTYDLAGKLTGIDTAGSATKTSFTFDALDRFATRTVGPSGSASVDTYSYVGGSETVARISNLTSGVTTGDSTRTRPLLFATRERGPDAG
jgi:YD repeat-containing protein